ncbi:hypothetical protein F8M41_005694 [Gigaspora margarita]|nr:hypothetical protein F8M41_005694 [Gigaspora margarita]
MSTSLDDTSFSNTVDELLNPCQCTTGAKCVCYDPVDDDSSLIENNYSTTHGDSATNSLPSIPSYNQPVVPKKPENCNQPIVPLVFGYRDSSAVFTRSSQSCPSAMASGSCCSTSATESVCRCGTGCNCEGCGTHSLTITPMRPVKNCCSNDSRVVSQYENEIDNDETLMERDVTSVEALLNPCKCLSGSECICCRPIEYIDFNSTSFETSSFTGYQTTMLECKCGAGCQCRGCEKSC